MRPLLRLLALPLLCGAVAGCTKNEADPRADSSAAADTSVSAAAAIEAITPSAVPAPGSFGDSSAMRGSAPATAVPGVAGPASPGAPGSDPQPRQPSPETLAALKAANDYTLTMPKLDRFMAAQVHVGRRMAALSPAELEAMQRSAAEAGAPGSESLDEMVQRIESNAVLKASISEAGLSVREYTLLGLALMQSGMAMQLLQARPAENADSLVRMMGVNPANVEFLRRNQAEIARKSNALAAQMR